MMAEIITLDNAINASLFSALLLAPLERMVTWHANLLMRFPDTFFIEKDFIVLYYG